jgi:hypothetical protein
MQPNLRQSSHYAIRSKVFSVLGITMVSGAKTLLAKVIPEENRKYMLSRFAE